LMFSTGHVGHIQPTASFLVISLNGIPVYRSQMKNNPINRHRWYHGSKHKCKEGTGTWPDYLVNRDDQKNEGPFGEKNCTKIEK